MSATGPPRLTVVGIGASAGGIDAFRGFFQSLPGNTGMSFLVVLHSSPHRRSLLADILARWTPKPVRDAADGDVIEPNQVIVVPPGVGARVAEGRLRFSAPNGDLSAESAPIDTLFDSMAIALGDHAVAVVLSGTGNDGALGLKAIKAHGGLTLVQGTDATSPQFSGMPDSALATGAVDLLVPVQDMPERIQAARLLREPTSLDQVQQIEEARTEICELLRNQIGHDFRQYKEPTFVRRVQRRMVALKVTDLAEYLRRLRDTPEEVVALFRDLLISVTSFFRDNEVFGAIEREVIPRLFRNKGATDAVRIWIPGCATGEEAYSLAMLLLEQAEQQTAKPAIRIFASDIDEFALGTARAGRYPASLLEGLAPRRRERFFHRVDNSYVVTREVRDLCTFSSHSLIRDPPFSRMDMISCRNVLIYLNSDLQTEVMPIFHYSLVPGGVLVLGSSENVLRQNKMFVPLDTGRRIFVRAEGPNEPLRMSILPRTDVRVAAKPASPQGASLRRGLDRAMDAAGRRQLARATASHVVVTADGLVVHFSGHTGAYLEPPAGSPSNNLFDLAGPGLASNLHWALRRAAETGSIVEHASIGRDSSAETVRLRIEPLAVLGGEPLYLVVFRPAEVIEGMDGEGYRPSEQDSGLVEQLEAELRELREQLQTITEEHGTALEELRSSNEELQSVNEELQSSLEEFETSKEEVQSINEELSTVNTELSVKVDLLDRTNADLKNLFESTKVATVFLDRHLVVRSFTPEIAAIYNLIPSDTGRPLTDIVSQLEYTTLREDVAQVLATLEPLERRLERKDRDAHYLMRLLPYRAPDSSVDGSLITFVDVTSIVRAEQQQRTLVDELNHRVKNMLTVVISLASNTLRRSETLESFGSVFIARIQALTAAYALVTREGWTLVPLRDVLCEELRPFLTASANEVRLDGPEVLIPPRSALALGMAVHELTTNAARYGALSADGGAILLSWAVEQGDQLVMDWVERGGPPVTPPTRRGFGLTLIERGLAHDLAATVTLDFAPDGLRARLQAPLTEPRPYPT